MEIISDCHTAVICLSHEELMRMGYSRGDTESLVNQPLAIPGICCSIFLREDRPDFVKVSMRSVGDIPVNRFCSDFFEVADTSTPQAASFTAVSPNVAADSTK